MTKLIDQGAVIAAFEAITLQSSNSDSGVAIVTRGAMISFLETVKNLPAHDEVPTLRDRFAMAALTGEMATCGDVGTAAAVRWVAQRCYAIADAMMDERAVD